MGKGRKEKAKLLRWQRKMLGRVLGIILLLLRVVELVVEMIQKALD